MGDHAEHKIFIIASNLHTYASFNIMKTQLLKKYDEYHTLLIQWRSSRILLLVIVFVALVLDMVLFTAASKSSFKSFLITIN